MGSDVTRNQTVYTPPPKPQDYGKPNYVTDTKSYIIPQTTGGLPNINGTPKQINYTPTGSTLSNVTTNGRGGRAPDPGKGSAYATPQQPPPNPYGYASGPGILEQWFNMRANGMDPGYQYAMNRGMNEIDNRMAAGGSYNSGARGQQLSDYAANMGAQREAQLDALAGGASGEYQGRLNSMFNQGNALAGGQSGINSSYDLAAGKSMSDALSALLGYSTEKAGVDSAATQGLINNGFGLISSFYGGGKKKS